MRGESGELRQTKSVVGMGTGSKIQAEGEFFLPAVLVLPATEPVDLRLVMADVELEVVERILLGVEAT